MMCVCPAGQPGVRGLVSPILQSMAGTQPPAGNNLLRKRTRGRKWPGLNGSRQVPQPLAVFSPVLPPPWWGDVRCVMCSLHTLCCHTQWGSGHKNLFPLPSKDPNSCFKPNFPWICQFCYREDASNDALTCLCSSQ